MTDPKPQARTRVRDLKPLAMASSLLAIGAAVFWAGTAKADGHAEIISSHGYSFYGDLKYPADYSQFDYVNADAPKGGEISISRLGTFDSMNPYTRKGRGGSFSTIMFESLLGDGTGNESGHLLHAQGRQVQHRRSGDRP